MFKELNLSLLSKHEAKWPVTLQVLDEESEQGRTDVREEVKLFDHNPKTVPRRPVQPRLLRPS